MACEALHEAVAAMAQVVLARIVGAVAEPHLDGRGLHGGRDPAALDDGRHGLRPHLRGRVAQRAEHVVGVLEGVAVDAAHSQATALDVVTQRGVVVHLVPGDVQGHGLGDARVAVHGAGVVDLLIDAARHPGLLPDAEACARVDEAPGRQLDLEVVHRPEEALHHAAGTGVDGLRAHHGSWILSRSAGGRSPPIATVCRLMS